MGVFASCIIFDLTPDRCTTWHNIQVSCTEPKRGVRLMFHTRPRLISGKKKNSRTLLLPLLQEAENRTHVALYHTPELRGFRKWLLPEKFNETIGVQHMKVYLFDDNLIISG